MIFLLCGSLIAMAVTLPSPDVNNPQSPFALSYLTANEQRALSTAIKANLDAQAALTASPNDPFLQKAVATAGATMGQLFSQALNKQQVATATSGTGSGAVSQADLKVLNDKKAVLQSKIASGDQAQITAATADYQATQATADANYKAANDGNKDLDGLNCSLKTLTVSGCIPIIFYYALYKPAYYLLLLVSKIFDFTIHLGINDQYVYPGGDTGFVATSWTIMRDISNMAFIFVLLYTGIMTMFGLADWKRTVIHVVIIALLVNFSLFFTKVVIDAGNILAVGVYSSMGPAPAGQRQDIALSIVNAFAPQTFITSTVDRSSVDAIIIFLIAAVVNIAAAWVFFKIALVFIGRLLAFWFLMIVSPFAFVSSTFPKGNKFSAWLDMLLSQAFVAPVFLFMLYLIMKVVNAGILQGFVNTSGVNTGTGITDRLILPVLVATLIVVALSKAKDFAEDMAGDFGKLGAKLGGAVMGVAGGVALGGAAFAGRKVIGGAAQALQNSGRLQNMATSDNYFARKLGGAGLNLSSKAQSASWDARGNKWVGKAAGASGFNLGSVPKTSDGGIVAAQKRKVQEDLAFADKLKVSEQEKRRLAAQANPGYTDAQNRAGVEQDASSAAQEAARTSLTGRALEQTQAQALAAAETLTSANAVAGASQEHRDLTTLNNSLAALQATEAEAIAQRVAAEDTFNQANISGTLTQVMTDALTSTSAAAANATLSRSSVETQRGNAQTSYDAAHGATLTAAQTAATSAASALGAAQASYNGSIERQASLAADAQLLATRTIISEAVKAADQVTTQRRAAYAQEVSQRGWTSGVFTEGDRVRQSETAAHIRASTGATTESTTEKLLAKLVAAGKIS